MKIYVINLDKDSQRLDFMTSNLTAAGLEFERFRAIHYTDIPPHCRPLADRLAACGLRPGEVGCTLSHVEVWKKIASGPDDFAIIFEDDVHITADFRAFCTGLDPDKGELAIHRLETFLARVTLKRTPAYRMGKRTAHQMLSNHGGAGAYLINRATAKAFLAMSDHFSNIVDVELFDPARGSVPARIKTYQWLPAPCIQDMFISRTFTSNLLERLDFDNNHLGPLSRWEPLKQLLRPLNTALQDLRLRPSGRTRRLIRHG
ncbi:glycosyltransferase family 25 protein [Asticcacaulis sp. SL142]|uniref:glycosyltransferase family 25 protein n=1 Tax=Asticcacaulis sp. SL142 TaxID=2995155 RepID=UPI00226C942C|nr:glycosyltransferase family 25 protein [Asticcacaulis sp. SL142]WAC49564.1 glycosyltransferase family 25 protein [Asticcacaulis sp. SL142]